MTVNTAGLERNPPRLKQSRRLQERFLQEDEIHRMLNMIANIERRVKQLRENLRIYW